jgi:hypothetical protein
MQRLYRTARKGQQVPGAQSGMADADRERWTDAILHVHRRGMLLIFHHVF